MTNEYFENGYVDDDPEPEELEDEMPDEPDYIALAHANWDILAESKRYDAWVDSRHIGRCEQLIRERDELIRAIENLAMDAGYNNSALMYMAAEDFGFPFLQQTLSGFDSETLEKMRETLQKELTEKDSRANQLALKMASENLAPIEAERKAS